MVWQKKQQWKQNISETLQKINNETAIKGNQSKDFLFLFVFEPTKKISNSNFDSFSKLEQIFPKNSTKRNELQNHFERY
jgi:hypothetical protein